MKSINEIQNIILEYGKKINSPKELLRVFKDPQPDGRPYITISSNYYVYTIEERGHVFQELKTDNLDTLLYWLMKDIIFEISTEHELNHREEHKDSRREMFKQQLDLFKKIKEEWYEKRKKEIENTLINSPYHDNL